MKKGFCFTRAIKGTKQCGLCGASFEYKFDRARYCSERCSVAGWKRQIGRVKTSPYPAYKKAVPALQTITIKQIYWAAGIYEGEGTVGTAGRGFVVSVGQRGPWLPNRLCELFGGRSYIRTQHGKDMSVWYATGARARGFLMTMYCLLSPRRQEQISNALLLWRQRAGGQAHIAA